MSTKSEQTRARLEGYVKPVVCSRATKQRQQLWASPAGCCLGTRTYRWGTDGQLRWPDCESRPTADTANCVAGEGVQGAAGDIWRFATLTDVPRHSANEISGNGHQRNTQTLPNCTAIWEKAAERFRCRWVECPVFNHPSVCVCVCVCVYEIYRRCITITSIKSLSFCIMTFSTKSHQLPRQELVMHITQWAPVVPTAVLGQATTTLQPYDSVNSPCTRIHQPCHYDCYTSWSGSTSLHNLDSRDVSQVKLTKTPGTFRK